jgi:hypothetical protein
MNLLLAFGILLFGVGLGAFSFWIQQTLNRRQFRQELRTQLDQVLGGFRPQKVIGIRQDVAAANPLTKQNQPTTTGKPPGRVGAGDDSGVIARWTDSRGIAKWTCDDLNGKSVPPGTISSGSTSEHDSEEWQTHQRKVRIAEHRVWKTP